MSQINNLHSQLIETVQSFRWFGLGVGTAGNASVRTSKGLVITPTGVDYKELTIQSLVAMDLDGDILGGRGKPSSEWPFHCAIYQDRPEIKAIIHVHSPYATGIACTRQGIPAFHYMVGLAGGNSIRCADYATFGTEKLSINAVKALQDRKACLLANHGQISVGSDLEQALILAQEVENLSQQYWISCQYGEPVLLDAEEMRINLEKFKHYGKQ